MGHVVGCLLAVSGSDTPRSILENVWDYWTFDP